MIYKIYYQINGKKFVENVSAKSSYEAIEKIKNKIQIDKIDFEDDTLNKLKNIFKI